MPRMLQMLATITLRCVTQIPTTCDRSFDSGRPSALTRERVARSQHEYDFGRYVHALVIKRPLDLDGVLVDRCDLFHRRGRDVRRRRISRPAQSAWIPGVGLERR